MTDPSKTCRQAHVEDDDEDDLDDLDDVLASFNAPKPGTAQSQTVPAATSSAQHIPTAPTTGLPTSNTGADPNDADPEFDAALMEGMESLLRQLAGNAGIMPDLPPTSRAAGAPGPPAGGAEQEGGKGKGKDMSPEEEEAAWQRAVESVLSGEGLRAMGLDDPSVLAGQSGRAPAAAATGPSATTPPPNPAPTDKPSFDDTIRRTMESLRAGGSSKLSGAGAGAGAGGSAGLEEFLRQMGHDPAALEGLERLGGLEGLEGLEGDDDLGGILDGMMSQLMGKEILEEPMAELESRYPAYLASPPTGTPAADLEKYKAQHVLVKQILAVFRKPNYSDTDDGPEVARLVGEMQDLGGPPKEIMGDMPEGFDLGALSGEDGCSIM